MVVNSPGAAHREVDGPRSWGARNAQLTLTADQAAAVAAYWVLVAP